MHDIVLTFQMPSGGKSSPRGGGQKPFPPQMKPRQRCIQKMWLGGQTKIFQNVGGGKCLCNLKNFREGQELTYVGWVRAPLPKSGTSLERTSTRAPIDVSTHLPNSARFSGAQFSLIGVFKSFAETIFAGRGFR